MTKEQQLILLELAIEQIKSDFKYIQQVTAANNETLYGFGIGMVAQLAGFFCAGNTIEALREKFKNEDFDAWYVWGLPEWNYEGNSGNKVSTFLENLSNSLSQESYDINLKEYEEILIKALQTCEQQGIFGSGLQREELVVYLQYSDAYDEDIDDEVAKLINSKENYLLFKNRWDDKRANLTKVVLDKIETL